MATRNFVVTVLYTVAIIIAVNIVLNGIKYTLALAANGADAYVAKKQRAAEPATAGCAQRPAWRR